MVTPLGCGVETAWKRLIEGKCRIRAITPEDLKMNNFDRETQLHVFDQKLLPLFPVEPTLVNSMRICCLILSAIYSNVICLPQDHRSISRFIGCALCAADEAVKDANWVPTEQEQKEKTGVSIGGGNGSIPNILDVSQMICDKILINMASGHASMRHGFQGPNHAVVTACATGAHSISDAARMIQFGDADVMVVVGTESSIDALSVAGFCRC